MQATSAELYQTPDSVASGLNLHCSPLFRGIRHNGSIYIFVFIRVGTLLFAFVKSLLLLVNLLLCIHVSNLTNLYTSILLLCIH